MSVLVVLFYNHSSALLFLLSFSRLVALLQPECPFDCIFKISIRLQGEKNQDFKLFFDTDAAEISDAKSSM